MTLFELLESEGFKGIMNNFIENSSHWHDILGLVGMVIVVSLYFGQQANLIDPKNLAFSLFNLIGGSLLLISLCFNFNLPSFIIEIFWVSISLIGIYNWLSIRKSVPIN